MNAPARMPRAPRVDPAGRPLEGRRRQALQGLAIVVLWVALMAGVFRVAGEFTGACLVALALLTWPAAEVVAGRRGLVWTGSALGIVGALTLGLGLSVVTPEMRAAPVPVQFAVVSGSSAAMMGFFALRFRLPGLISPTITFTIVALFFAIYGSDPARLAEVEGLSARGVLAAMLSSSFALAVFGVFSAGLVAGGRWLDLNGDDFGLAAARPLHLIGAAILALVAARLLALLPVAWDLAGLVLAWVVAALWSLRINRFAVMVAAFLAMAKPTLVALGALAGFAFTRADWAWALPGLLAVSFAIWPLMHREGMRRGFILGPGGHAPVPGDWWWWRYWPYAPGGLPAPAAAPRSGA